MQNIIHTFLHTAMLSYFNKRSRKTYDMRKHSKIGTFKEKKIIKLSH